MKRPAAVLLACVLACSWIAPSFSAAAPSPAEVAPPVPMADFSAHASLSNLQDQGRIGCWTLHPNDPQESCAVSQEEEPSGKAMLVVRYNVQGSPPERAKVGIWIRTDDLDLSRYNTIEIEVRGSAKEGYPEALRVEVKKPDPSHPGSMIWASWILKDIGPDWKTFQIPMSRMTGITDWREIAQVVITFVDRMSQAKKGRIDVRSIRAVREGALPPWPGDIYQRRILKRSDAVEGLNRARMQVKRLRGFPERVHAQRKFPLDSRQFLLAVASDTWKFFDNAVDNVTGLPLDTLRLSADNPMGKDTQIGDFTNITNIGLYFLCLPAAEDFGFLGHAEAQERALKALRSLQKMETYKGFFYNYYDTTTLERTTHFLSSVDTGWLVAGLAMLRDAYPGEVAEIASGFIRHMDLGFFYDPCEGEIYHGFFTNVEAYSEYHYGVFFTEARAFSYLAIAKGDVPEEHWFRMARTFPVEWDWQSQKPVDRKVAEAMGTQFLSGYYLWNKKPIVPSWGGSMFEALFPPLVIDEKGFSPQGWGLNDERHVQAQIDFAKEKGYRVWGMSPSSDPHGTYSEYGVKKVGMHGYPAGAVTPHATMIALPFACDAAVENLRNLLKYFPESYGEYGFYDALDPTDGTIAYKYLALDQGMSFLGLANALNPGKIYGRLQDDPLIKNGARLLQAENPLPN